MHCYWILMCGSAPITRGIIPLFLQKDEQDKGQLSPRWQVTLQTNAVSTVYSGIKACIPYVCPITLKYHIVDHSRNFINNVILIRVSPEDRHTVGFIWLTESVYRIHLIMKALQISPRHRGISWSPQPTTLLTQCITIHILILLLYLGDSSDLFN